MKTSDAPKKILHEPELYEKDYYRWLQTQVELLRLRRFEGLDLENLIDEVGSLARMDRYEAMDALRGILWRLLVYEFKPKYRNKRLRLELLDHRHHLEGLLADSPSLREELELSENYQEARRLAALSLNTDASKLPESCPYTFEQVLDTDFFPMAKSDRRAMRSRLVLLLAHLLKYHQQLERRGVSWQRTMREARNKLARSFEEMPTLRRYAAEDLADCYGKARERAATETGLPSSTFPETCPYDLEQILDPNFLPDA